MSHALGSRRRRILLLLGSITVIGALLVFLVPAFAVTGALTGSSFESGDGNLTAETGGFDWNSFSPVTWTGTAPYQTATKTASDGLAPPTTYKFLGLTDGTKDTTTDTHFEGGTKQDDDCATIINAAAPNKDDMKRVYLASSVGTNNHIFLDLAWERIPLNTTDSSAHIAFEFNQGSTACPQTTWSPTHSMKNVPLPDGPLVQRTAGDLLVLYDFTGGSGGVATITIERWVTGTNTVCAVPAHNGTDCWGPPDVLNSSQANAAVDSGGTFPSSVTDTLAPGGTDTLGFAEFGEAGIDLTAAGIVSATQCSFGAAAHAVSRSSGDSATAAMEDLVGPGPFTISRCGTLIVKKVTVPSPDTTSTQFSFTVNGPTPNNVTLPKTFSLTNGQTNSSQVLAGTTYSAAENSVPANWKLTSASCDNGTGTLSPTPPVSSGSTGTISNISVGTNETVTCTFTDQGLGAIKIIKTGKDLNCASASTSIANGTCTGAGTANLSGAQFTYKCVSASCTDSNTHNFPTTGSDGTACVSGLQLASYTVQETGAPPHYSIDTTTGQPVTVDAAGSCSTGTQATKTFTDSPLTDITATSTAEIAGTTNSTITCNNSPTTSAADPATLTVTGLKPGTYTCTVVIDP